MKAAPFFGLMLALSMSGAAAAADDSVMKELVPTGTLRVGVAYGPAPTPIFVAKDPAGDVHGVPRDLGGALAKTLGVPVEIIVRATTNELAEAASSGAIDIGFMPADDERRKRVDFTPPYFVIECTYLSIGPSGIATFAEVDRPEVTVVGINGSATMRAATRSLKRAKIVAANSADEATAMLKSGSVQALALTHDALPAFQTQLPGSRILDGAFQTIAVAIAVPKDHPAALAYVTGFIEKAKADGLVRRAFDDAGLKDLPVAP